MGRSSQGSRQRGELGLATGRRKHLARLEELRALAKQEGGGVFPTVETANAKPLTLEKGQRLEK